MSLVNAKSVTHLVKSLSIGILLRLNYGFLWLRVSSACYSMIHKCLCANKPSQLTFVLPNFSQKKHQAFRPEAFFQEILWCKQRQKCRNINNPINLTHEEIRRLGSNYVIESALTAATSFCVVLVQCLQSHCSAN